jgi:hypothetical protein
MLALPRNLGLEQQMKNITRTIEGDLVPPKDVTFLELMAHPEKYDGKRIRVSGYYRTGFETSGLFEKEVNQSSFAGFWLDDDSTFARAEDVHRPNDCYLTIEGVFNANERRHLGGWRGSIQNITRITKTKLSFMRSMCAIVILAAVAIVAWHVIRVCRKA